MSARADRAFLHLFLTDGLYESRFLKEANSTLGTGMASRIVLAAHWRAGVGEGRAVTPSVSVWRPRLLSGYLPRYLPFQLVKGVEWRWRVALWAGRERPLLVHGHGLVTLAAGVRVSKACGAPLLYDAHELETEANGLGGLRKRVYKAAERRLIHRAAAVLVVSDSIADWYAQEYGIERPAVVRNVPLRPEGPPPARSPILRAAFGIPDGELIFLYAGGLFRGRRVEQFLRVFSRVADDRHVVFMGYGELEGMVRATAATRRNVHFLPAVPPSEVLCHTGGADVGLSGGENVCLSYYYSLPNKLFEYLLAGVPAAGADWPEIRRVLEADECGWIVGETDEEWLRFVSDVSLDEIHAKREGALRARMRYSWQQEEGTLLGVYRRLLGHNADSTIRATEDARTTSG